MNVGELKRRLENIPDDTVVLIGGGYDHSYYTCNSVSDTHAETVEGRLYWEYHNDENMEPDGKKVRAVVIN